MLQSFLSSIILTPWTAHYAECVTDALSIATMDEVEGPWALPDLADGEESPVMTRSKSFAGSLASNNTSVVTVSSMERSQSAPSVANSPTVSFKRPRGLSDAETNSSNEHAGGGMAKSSSKYTSALRRVHEDPLVGISTELSNAAEYHIAVQITRLTWDIFRNISVSPFALASTKLRHKVCNSLATCCATS